MFLLSVTPNGDRMAGILENSLPPLGYSVQARHSGSGSSVRDAIEEAFVSYDAIVLFMAIGGAVRYISRYTVDKLSDPAVVCVDDSGRFAVPVLSGHSASANELAEDIAGILNATPVITTATDSLGRESIEGIAERLLCSIPDRESIIRANAEIVRGRRVAVRNPSGLRRKRVAAYSGKVAGDSIELVISKERPETGHWLLPYRISIGLGYTRGATVADVEDAIRAFLEEHDLGVEDIDVVTSAKEDSVAEEASKSLGIRFERIGMERVKEFDASRLSSTSHMAQEALGIPGMSEPCALLALGPTSRILFPKESFHSKVTVAAAFAHRPSGHGKVYFIGVGPSGPEYLTEAARVAIARSDVVAGYSTPLSVVKPLLRNKYVITVRWKEQATSISEVKRLFREGHKISFLFTGDSCFSEGELISRFLDEVDRYEVIPGISSVQVASAKSMFPLEVCSVISFHVTGPLNQRKESLRSVLEKGGCALVLPRPYDFMPREVSRYLVESGIPPDLPVRIMENLTRGDERITDCTIGSVPDRQYSDLCIMALGRSPLPLDYILSGSGQEQPADVKNK
ncbi:precorrin-3B C(17)-methyltransferase [Thermogymnomonas acidicola]|uniref:Precorrin-3B C(17)-methyltransferase n=1 Tax=Thermogymnomonas acidicola TaxID=399579 RepID=A0AA37BRI1_9ARCH|nr:precorrin-3B C(17)-methyltransferase [Thermogymnomonas acidicola]